MLFASASQGPQGTSDSVSHCKISHRFERISSMGLTTRFKRYATVVFLASLGLLVTGQGALHATASNGWTGDVPLPPGTPTPLRTLYVDRDSKGGTCSDSYTSDENNQ